MPHALSTAEIRSLVDAFAAAAERAEKVRTWHELFLFYHTLPISGCNRTCRLDLI